MEDGIWNEKWEKDNPKLFLNSSLKQNFRDEIFIGRGECKPPGLKKNIGVNLDWKSVTLPWNDNKTVNELNDEKVK